MTNKADMIKPPYTIAEYEALARRIPYRDGAAMTFTERWDTVALFGDTVVRQLQRMNAWDEPGGTA